MVRTGMSRAGNKRFAAGSSGGFTLLELLVVIAVLALIVGITTPVLDGALSGAKLKAAARELAAALRYTRGLAVTQNKETTVRVDVGERSYRISESQRRFQLPPAVELKVLGAESESPDDRIGGIRFFPDGSSTGGTISVAQDDRRYEIRVDWMLGRVTLDE